MEVLLQVESGVGEVVHEGSLLNEPVLVVDSHVLQLLLGLLQVRVLVLLHGVVPLGDHLAPLVSREHVVEDGELGPRKPEEVPDLRVAHEEGDEELVVEDQPSDPLVVVPPAQLGDGHDRADVEEKENDSSPGSAEGLVVRRHLLGSRGLSQVGVEFLHAREDERVLGRVVWVLVALLVSEIVRSVLSSELCFLGSALLFLQPGLLESVLDGHGRREVFLGGSKQHASEGLVAKSSSQHSYNYYTFLSVS